MDLAETILGAFSMTAYKAQRAEQSQLTVNERRLQEESISDMVGRVAVTTATLPRLVVVVDEFADLMEAR